MTRSVEVIESKSGDLNIRVDSVTLHSEYNPKTEAEKFALENINVIDQRPTIMVLGLGMGHHINAISLLSKLRHSNPRIAVIEANPEIAQAYLDHGGSPDFQIFTASRVEDLYANKALLDFLFEAPGLIYHQSSFQLDREFYTDFLKYRPRNKLIGETRVHNDLTTYLKETNALSINEINLEYKNRFDFLTKALRKVKIHEKASLSR